MPPFTFFRRQLCSILFLCALISCIGVPTARADAPLSKDECLAEAETDLLECQRRWNDDPYDATCVCFSFYCNDRAFCLYPIDIRGIFWPSDVNRSERGREYKGCMQFIEELYPQCAE